MVDAAGLLLASSFGVLAARSLAPPVPLATFGACMAVAWLAFALVLARFVTRPHELPVLRVVAWAVALRGLGLLADPVLEDDFYRYLWDGRSFVTTGTPYGSAPMDHFADPTIPLAFQAVLDRINNPDLPTIYGPVSQIVFALGHLVAPLALWPLKLVLLAADGAAMAMLLRLGGPRALLVFAWCPLAIHESAFNAHPDAIGVAFALGAFVALGRQGRRGAVASGACIALAVASKALALVLLPLLLGRAGPRRGPALAAAFAVVLALLYAPFFVGAGAADLPVLFVFGREWEFNSTLFAVVAHAAGPHVARGVAVLAVAIAMGAVLVHEARASRRGDLPALARGDWLLGVLFLVSPVVNPWYLLWLLPFVALRPTRWGLAALSVVSLSYVHGLFVAGLPAYHHPVWVRPVELVVVATALCLDLWAARRGSAQVDGASFDEMAGPRLSGEAT